MINTDNSIKPIVQGSQQQKRIEVVAGIIVSDFDNLQHVLLAKRPVDKHQGGLWEFPGGKVDAGETQQQSLSRELLEELNIKVIDSRFYYQQQFDYVDKLVELNFYWVSEYSGSEVGAEGQRIKWVELARLDEYEFPEANQIIVDKLKATIKK